MSDPLHLLLYEPRTEGHHLGWLRFIVDDLLDANFRLSVAADLRPGKRELVEQNLVGLSERVELFSAYDQTGHRHLGGQGRSVAHCLKISRAGRVFLCALDEIASHWWRCAAFGLYPPVELRGCVGGIYHRPRFLAASKWSPDRALKILGFHRLLREGWWRQLLFVDEFLAMKLRCEYPSSPICFLPDPCPPGYDGDMTAARAKLGIPPGRCVLLFYGTGARRKGLHLAVEAMLQLPQASRAFLFCAGQQNVTGRTAGALTQLVRQGRARLLDRYVSVEEEKLCFAASDVVLLPYLNHFGSSGVFSRAMSALKPVIVSNEQLLGRLTREHRLGFVFPSGNVPALRDAFCRAMQLPTKEVESFAAAARSYSGIHSREAFRAALLGSLSAG
jgi:glycosyltransferase involved in cell wall biosynthesis